MKRDENEKQIMMMICGDDLIQYKELMKSTVNEYLMKLDNWIKKQKQ